MHVLCSMHLTHHIAAIWCIQNIVFSIQLTSDTSWMCAILSEIHTRSNMTQLVPTVHCLSIRDDMPFIYKPCMSNSMYEMGQTHNDSLTHSTGHNLLVACVHRTRSRFSMMCILYNICEAAYMAYTFIVTNYTCKAYSICSTCIPMCETPHVRHTHIMVHTHTKYMYSVHQVAHIACRALCMEYYMHVASCMWSSMHHICMCHERIIHAKMILTHIALSANFEHHGWSIARHAQHWAYDISHMPHIMSMEYFDGADHFWHM